MSTVTKAGYKMLEHPNCSTLPMTIETLKGTIAGNEGRQQTLDKQVPGTTTIAVSAKIRFNLMFEKKIKLRLYFISECRKHTWVITKEIH